MRIVLRSAALLLALSVLLPSGRIEAAARIPGESGPTPPAAAARSPGREAECAFLSLIRRHACLRTRAAALRAGLAALAEGRRSLLRRLQRLGREAARIETRRRRLETLARELADDRAALFVEDVRIQNALLDARTRYRRTLPAIAAALRGDAANGRHARALMLALGHELAAVESERERLRLSVERAGRESEALRTALAGIRDAGQARVAAGRNVWRALARLDRVLERQRRLLAGVDGRLRHAAELVAVAEDARERQLASGGAGPNPPSPARSRLRILPRPLPLLARHPAVDPTPARVAGATLAPPGAIGEADRPPLPGVVLARFGERVGAFPSRGIAVAVARPTAVRAPRAGRVVFAGRLRGMGVVLILDHGGGYHTVFAGLGRVSVAPRTVVVTGDVLGMAVPVRGRPARVYMELRYMGRPVDPARGLAALATDRHSG